MIRLRLRDALAFLALPAVAACSSPSGRLPPLASAPPQAYRVGPGDELRITVFGVDPLSNGYIVSDTGTVSLPLLAPVAVAGRSVAEVEAAVAQAVQARDLVKTPSVTAQIVKYRPFFILGEVQRPGQYPYIPGMSLTTAVSVAGGFTFRARTTRASIARTSGGAVERGSARPDTPVLPGDTITIEERTF